MQDEYLTVEEVSQLVQAEEQTVRAWLDEGLPHVEDGGVIRIKHSDLDTFLARLGQGRARDAAST